MPTPTPAPAPTKFAFAVPSPTATHTRTPTPTATPTATHTPTYTRQPTLTRTRVPSSTPVPPSPTPVPRVSVPNEIYGLLAVVVPAPNRTPHPPAQVNLAARGYTPTNARLDLMDIAGPYDPAAPQLASLFTGRRTPEFRAAYQLHGDDGALLAEPAVTMIALAAHPDETLHVPASGYNIGEGYNVLVLYAGAERIVLSYTREDNPIRGYALYLEGIAVASDLLTLYQRADSAGRGELPALRVGQAFARARSGELKLAIRDAGAFMDPRSRKDWWR